MIKQLLLYGFVFFVLYKTAFTFHENYLVKQGVILPFSLKKVYLFHMVFSLLICVNFKLFSIVNKIFEQLGYLYLVSLVLKIILFVVVFYNVLFSEVDFTFSSRISLFIPMLVFLLTEAFFVARILNEKR